MKFILTLILFLNSAFAITNQSNIDSNTTIISKDANQTDNNITKIDYQKDIKRYFTSRDKIGINARKSTLRNYYKKEKYQLIWLKDEKLNPIYSDLITSAKNDKIISKKAKKDFNIDDIEKLIEIYKTDKLTKKQTLQLDFLLTNLYDNYITCVAKGSINWKEFKTYLKDLYEEKDILANWEKYGAKVNKQKLLKETIQEDDFHTSLNKIDLKYPNSNKLYEKIAQYEEIEKNGGYVKVPTVRRSLKVGMHSKIVPILKQRLIQSHDLVVEDTNTTVQNTSEDTNATIVKKDNTIYTKEIANAIKSFQKNNGLAVDGICGRDTIRHLNITVKQRINKIKVNLERMRWMRRDLGKEYLLVNIPDYYLRYYKNNKEILKLSVVVGTKTHPTPIFSHKLSTVVLNPYWRVPKRIVQREIIPKLVKDPTYLNSKDMDIHEDWSIKSEIFNPVDINWSMYAQDEEQKENNIYPDVPYRFIQIPGKKNPLGKMKFMFHNRYMVYLHDTSAKYYFKKRKRAYSHGCIRLHNPRKLLKTIANDDTKLDYKEAQEILEDIEQTEISLKKRIPIHIVYLTAWVDNNDQIQFRDDIYGYDKIQKKILY